MEMQQTAKRLDHIDIAKAIGLLLVIYGHTFRMSMRAVHPWCAFSYTFVYRFHVPLLYFLSGMGCTLTAQKNRSLSARQFLHKKVHSLLLPWGVYSAFLYLLFYLANRLPPVQAAACRISLAGAAQREPIRFSSVVSAHPVLVCPHGMAAGQISVPGGSPGGKAGTGGSAARVLSAVFCRLVLGGKKLLSAGRFFLSGLRAPA